MPVILNRTAASTGDRRDRFGGARPVLAADTEILAAMPTYRVTREITFCYGHRLLNHAGKCRHLHGHNGKAVVTLEAPGLDSQGMVVDFGEIKQEVQRWIDANLDHTLLLCRDDPLLPVLLDRDERVYVMDANPTAENIARLIFDQTAAAGLPVVEVVLWETDRCSASYSP